MNSQPAKIMDGVNGFEMMENQKTSVDEGHFNLLEIPLKVLLSQQHDSKKNEEHFSYLRKQFRSIEDQTSKTILSSMSVASTKTIPNYRYHIGELSRRINSLHSKIENQRSSLTDSSNETNQASVDHKNDSAERAHRFFELLSCLESIKQKMQRCASICQEKLNWENLVHRISQSMKYGQIEDTAEHICSLKRSFEVNRGCKAHPIRE